jgi:hypothetical protein
MNRRLFTLLVTMLALSAMLVSAGAVAAMPPLSFSSNIRVQNIEDQEANIVISFYDLDGDGEPVQQLHDKIAARSDAIYWTVDVSGLGQGWSGSAVVGSDREIRVVNNLYTEDWMFQGSSQGYLNGAYEVGIPLIQLSNKDWDSWFNVQNVGPEEARVYVVFEPGLAGRQYETPVITLPPFVSYTFDPRELAIHLLGPTPVGADRDRQAFVGAATVYSEGSPVVATCVEGSDLNLMVYDGFATVGTEGLLVAPLYHTNHNTTFSSIHVQNRGAEATEVTMHFVPSKSVSAAGKACTETQVIEPGAMQVFGFFAFGDAWQQYTPNSDCFVENGAGSFIGSAYIDQSTGNVGLETGEPQPLVAQVQEFTVATGTGSAYNGSSPVDAAPYLAFPEMLDRSNGYWTSINLFNASPTDSEDITIEYRGHLDQGHGEPVSKTQKLTLGPLESTNILHAASSASFAFELGDGFVGSALLMADDGDAQLVAVTNKLFGPPSKGDVLSTYNAFPLWELPSNAVAP